MSSQKRKELAEKGRRTVPVTFYCTNLVKAECEEMAALLSLSHSKLWTAIAEGLVQSGFSIAGFARLGMAIHKELKKNPEYQQGRLSFWNPLEKLPPLIEYRTEDLTDEERGEILRDLKLLVQNMESASVTPKTKEKEK